MRDRGKTLFRMPFLFASRYFQFLKLKKKKKNLFLKPNNLFESDVLFDVFSFEDAFAFDCLHVPDAQLFPKAY